MAFIYGDKLGEIYAPGWFLAHEECERKTKQISQNHAQVVTENGTKHVPMGAFWPANNSSTVKGIVYEDVDVTAGDMPGSVVLSGVVYLDRLPAQPESGVQSALEGLGFKFIAQSPAVTRPSDGKETLKTIGVESAAGTAAGDTALTLTYTPGSGESYVYKVDTDAPVIAYGQIPDYTWTPWDGTSDITATTGKKITVASVNADGRAVAAGSATVTAKA